MIQAEELLSRLNAKTQSYSLPIQGNKTTLDPFHIAAAIGLAAAPDGAKYLARLRYAGQMENAPKATHELLIIIKGKYTYLEKRKSYRNGLFIDMCMMAIGEYIQSELCKSCKGAGSAMIDYKKVACPYCEGIGIVIGQNTARSANLGIPGSTWRKSWKWVYGDMLDILSSWDRQICSKLRF